MEKIKIFAAVIFAGFFGFFCGKMELQKSEKTEILQQKILPEISLINLKKIVGDQIFVEISGPARILWGEQKFVENDGEFKIPLPQILTEKDLKFREFPFVGNEKTKKFYPATSQFARGTKVKNRRFFQTKKAAIDAGFIPSKLVK